MKQEFTISISICCILFCTSFCLTAFKSGDWVHTCVPLETILFKSSAIDESEMKQTINLNEGSEKQQKSAFSDPELAKKYLEIQSFSNENSASFQKKLEKSTFCASKGLFKHCVFGNSFLDLGSYEVCISNAETQQDLSSDEKLILYALFFSILFSMVAFLLLVLRLVFCKIKPSRIDNFIDYTTASLNFTSGMLLFLCIYTTISKAIEFTDNKTTFYNFILQKLFKDYANVGLIKWQNIDDIPDAESWGRTVVKSMDVFSLGSAFYMVLFSAVFMLFSCACLIYRPQRNSRSSMSKNTLEKYR